MNKSESKYFNTAVKMDLALISLLKKKPFEYITVSEICETAGVNVTFEKVADAVDGVSNTLWKMKVTLPHRLNDEDVKVSIVPLDKPSPHTDCGLHNVILKLLRR